jgi:anti-sigma factor RsiW
MPISCEQVAQLLLDYVEHSLSGAVRQQVQQHLTDCRDCAELERTYQATRRLCAQVQVHPVPPDAAEQLVAALRTRLQNKG